MRLSKVLIILMAFVTLISCSKEDALVFDDTTYNFGTIPNTEKVSHTFEFKNDRMFSVKIKQIGTSCSCAVSEYTIEEVKSGEKGMIKVEFDPSNYSGKTMQKLTVIGDGFDPQDLYIIANVTEK